MEKNEVITMNDESPDDVWPAQDYHFFGNVTQTSTPLPGFSNLTIHSFPPSALIVKTMRTCIQCGIYRDRSAFSRIQLSKGNTSRCNACVTMKTPAAISEDQITDRPLNKGSNTYTSRTINRGKFSMHIMLDEIDDTNSNEINDYGEEFGKEEDEHIMIEELGYCLCRLHSRDICEECGLDFREINDGLSE